jgi:hypothetical protein
MVTRITGALVVVVGELMGAAVVARPVLPAVHSVYNLSVPRGAMCAAAVGPDCIAFAGGTQAGLPKGSPPSDDIEIFNVSSSGWVKLEKEFKLPHARGGDSTNGGWLEDLGIAFFGSGGGDSGSVDVLRASDMEWLPSLKTTLVHEFTACAGTGKTIACAGGQGHNKSDTHVPAATDVWTFDTDGTLVRHDSSHKLAVPRKKLAAAAAGDAIVFGTGYDDALPKGTGYSAAWEMLNTTTGEWTSGTLPSGVARQYGTAVGCGGKVIFAGGQLGGRSDAVDIFDAATQQWSNATLTVARSNLAAACAANRFAVIAGGQIPGCTAVDVLDTQSGTWGTLAPLNFGRGWLVGAGAGDCVVFGSGPGVRDESSAASVDEYCFGPMLH